MPSIRLVDDKKADFVQLKPEGAVGPVLVMRPEIYELPPGRLDFLVAQALVHLSVGSYRIRRLMRVLLWLVILPVGCWFGYRYGWIAIPFLYPVGGAIGIAISAAGNRIMMRRVDRRLAAVFGAEWLADALRELAEAWSWRRGFRWLWRGAVPLPPERLGWVEGAQRSAA